MTENTKKAPEQKFGDEVQETQNKFINSNYITKINELVEQGLSVYLLQPKTSIPYKGSKGHLSSVNDIKELKRLIEAHGDDSNVGISLVDTDIVTLDIDRHGDKNGFQSLLDLGIKFNLDEEAVEITPNAGAHVFFKVPDGVDVNNLNHVLATGVELLTNHVTVSPSSKIVDKKVAFYRHYGLKITEANTMPKWLIDLATKDEKPNKPMHSTMYSVSQRWEMVLNGFSEGERNNQAVSVSGYLLRINLDPNTAFDVVKLINSRSVAPLPDREIFTTFKSVYEIEKKRRKRGINDRTI
ncbi:MULTISPECIES: bifunctional DNA primase/polymerase [Leuconostoc]|uniref:bifunctional DNA primase/polymerase n=1 Tax=Leuconostoc TaxID=1243 RepID=UPI000A06C674|nr:MULTISPECIES: bifunctional DNA primase/polymerase [Leuconostoc]MDG9745257.1 bifunctional DNA primase/polymerase [Leuconostoc falkenbergense]QQB01356.1 bifunctional DNA primase/polymerase [Leuconostoc pseudomesenteroides]